MDHGLIVVTRRAPQRGFTVIEMMVVVAVIAILAALVVPGWFRESRKTKASTEVSGMFTEISVKEEQYKIENHAFLAATTCPATPTPSGVDYAASCLTGSSAWDNLRINPPEKNVQCTYTITTGAPNATPSPPSGFTMVTPVTGWWFAVAECDSDGAGGTNATFFMNSVDTQIQKQNEGL